jgi:hypothetical protein
MRSIKELLELMLQHQELFKSGLCHWVGRLHCHGVYLISFDEYYVLKRYIKENRPSKYFSLVAYKHRNSDFYWELGCIHPRIKWIKKHIKKNK